MSKQKEKSNSETENNNSKTLNELSGYNKLVEYYNQNKDLDWSRWLKYDFTFKNCGKQGIVGVLVNSKKGKSKKNGDLKYCFKISQSLNFLIRHEYMVMKHLNTLSNYCPHFCQPVGIINCKLNLKVSKDDTNPFSISEDTKYPVEHEVLLSEYIEDSCKFYNYIRSDKISDNVIYACVKQVLCAIMIAQNICRFTHYDLHSYNIMMKKCDPDIVFLYVIEGSKKGRSPKSREQSSGPELLCVPSYGHYPKIIDFGFSYSDSMKNDYLYPSLAHTDVGFLSDRYDWVSDPKLFLTTVSKEIKVKRRNNNSITFRNMVKNIFGNLSIDLDSGWDTIQSKGISDYITTTFMDNANGSKFFKKYAYKCVDLIQSLILLPLEKQATQTLEVAFKTFRDEFIKIERLVSDHNTLIYILRRIVDVTRAVHLNYISNPEETLVYYSQSIYAILDSVSSYCNPKIHFEKLLCSLLSLSRNMEGRLYQLSEKKLSRKYREYLELPVKNTRDIYDIINFNIKSDYKYTDKTSVFIFDTIKKDTYTMALNPLQIKTINSTEHTEIPELLYKYYKKIYK